MSIELRPADERGLSSTDWLCSRHSFSYGDYYDPTNLSFGVLVACNDDELAAGRGFGLHRHADLEIVTWMVSGQLRHQHDDGRGGVGRTLTAGMAQCLSAGAGVEHAEHASEAGPARYLQMWLRPSVPALQPVYASHDFAAMTSGRWTPIASGLPDSVAPLRLRQLDAELHAVRLAPGQQVLVPIAPLAHLQVSYGRVVVEEAGRGGAGRVEGVSELAQGDALRVTGATALRLRAVQRSELLLWLMYA